MEQQESGSNPQTKNLETYQAILQINQQQQTLKTKEVYWKAYIFSVLFPPIGIYYFIKFFFFREINNESRKAATISLILTIASLILNIWFIQLFFAQTTPSNTQNLNMLKDLITPENQKTLRQLMQ